ncbi:MAG: hypothetical protein IAI49_02595 [Candidatus Eremiobacteraeota bacterium]|nr:hypothetical protein [Candidatus Eremiobacteraeota bacterium]
MPTIDKIQKEIATFEGFEVTIHPETSVAPARLPSYAKQYERRARQAHTVRDWKRLRFSPTYPSLAVDILLGDGRKAADRMKLEKVRQSHD